LCLTLFIESAVRQITTNDEKTIASASALSILQHGCDPHTQKPRLSLFASLGVLRSLSLLSPHILHPLSPGILLPSLSHPPGEP